jgi:hypothetical protein
MSNNRIKAQLKLPEFTATLEGTLGLDSWVLTIAHPVTNTPKNTWKIQRDLLSRRDVTAELWFEAIELIQEYHKVEFLEEEAVAEATDTTAKP